MRILREMISVDPICGMSVAPERAAARATVDGEEILFCAVRCRERFLAEPARWREARDPVCGRAVSRLHPPATARVGGEPYFFCGAEHRDRFLAERAAPPAAAPTAAPADRRP